MSVFPDRPFALSIGPQRAGTSWIDRYLREKSDVCLPRDVKETFFFDHYYQKGMDYYAGLFHPRDKHQIMMEVSATYFDCGFAPERIYKSLGPDIALICPLRAPVERSYSLYKHYLRYGIVSGSLAEAVKQKSQIISSSFYAKHLKNWAVYFDLTEITFLFQEELEQDPDSFAKSLCDAIGVTFNGLDKEDKKLVNQATQSPNRIVAGYAQKGADWLRSKGIYWPVNLAKSVGLKRAVFGKEAQTRQKSNIPQGDRAFLQEKLSDEKEKLEALLGQPVRWWE